MTVLTTTRGEKDLPRWFAPCFAMISRMTHGSVDVVLPDGRTFRAEGAAPGPHGVLRIRNKSLTARLVREGDLGFGEAYMEGWWDSPDLQALMDVILANNDAFGRSFPGAGLVRTYERFLFRLSRNSRTGARRNIAHHYDLGNEFYRTWLDETMTYSSAIYAAPEEDLAAAQRRKYAEMCDRIGVREDASVLEIGCGWGGFAEYAAKERGARVTALTISRAQHAFAQRRIFEAGLAERVRIELRDYRDEAGRYDGLASIEMFEAVGESYWPVYFDTVRERLRPGAAATLQVITVHDRLFAGYRRGVDFIQKYIFPGGMLPSPTVLREQIRRAGLEVGDSVEFGQSYSETLREWNRRFQDRWDDIQALGFDTRFRRMWEYYLTSCAACFRSGTTDVTQISMRRPV